jgi:hypothetical protein
MTTTETLNHLAPYEPIRAQIAELKAANAIAAGKIRHVSIEF